MITDLFDALGNIATDFGSFMVKIFGAVSEIIYTPGAGEAPGSLTIVGYFLLIGLVAGVLIWALRWVLSLIKLK